MFNKTFPQRSPKESISYSSRSPVEQKNIISYQSEITTEFCIGLCTAEVLLKIFQVLDKGIR